MSIKSGFRAAFVIASLGLSWGQAGAAESAKAGAGGLYTYFQESTDGKSLGWSTCGSTGPTSGCYGAGTLQGFGNACAALSGPGGRLYVFDKQSLDANGEPTQEAALFVFRQSIEVSGDGQATVSFRQVKKAPLPLQGGATAHCFIAANAQDVVLGTDADGAIAWLDKKTNAVRPGASGAGKTSSITANEAGFVVIVNEDKSLAIYDQNSQLQQSGGTFTNNFVPNRLSGVQLGN